MTSERRGVGQGLMSVFPLAIYTTRSEMCHAYSQDGRHSLGKKRVPVARGLEASLGPTFGNFLWMTMMISTRKGRQTVIDIGRRSRRLVTFRLGCYGHILDLPRLPCCGRVKTSALGQVLVRMIGRHGHAIHHDSFLTPKK
jgi:hypothetical protein